MSDDKKLKIQAGVPRTFVEDYTSQNFKDAVNAAFIPQDQIIPNVSSVSFNGTSTYVGFGNNLNYSSSSQFTLEISFRPDDLAATNTLFAKIAGSSAPGWFIQIDTLGRVLFSLRNSSSNAITARTPTSSIQSGVFNHLIITYAGTGLFSGVNIYINGIKQTLTNLSDTLTLSTTNTENLEIGRLANVNWFEGFIDFATAWNDDLDDYQASELFLMLGKKAPTFHSRADALVNWWRFGDGDTWPTVTDNVGNVDGTVVSGTGSFSTTVSYPSTVVEASNIQEFDAFLSNGTIFPHTPYANNPTKVTGLTALAGQGNDAVFSPDGRFLAVAHNTTPFIRLYEVVGDNFIQLPNPPQLPAGNAQGVSWSPDGRFLAVAHVTTPFVTIYERSGNLFTKVANPATLPAGNANNCHFSHNGRFLSVAHATTPFVTTYEVRGNTFTKIADPASLPAGQAFDVGFSPDSTLLVVAVDVTPFVEVYQISGTTFTKITGPAALAGGGRFIHWSYNGDYLSVTHGNSPFMATYKRVDNTLVRLPNPDVLPASTTVGARWNRSSDILTIGHISATQDYLTIYRLSGESKLTRLATFSDPIAGTGRGHDWSPDGKYMAIAHSTTPFITIYRSSGVATTTLNKKPKLINKADLIVNPSSPSSQQRFVILKDVKAAGVQGGTFTAGAYQTRVLNTSEDPTGVLASFASNQFALPAGDYFIEASAPAYAVNEHKLKLRNITDAADVLLGTTGFSNNGAANNTHSFLYGHFTITAQKTFEIQHRCQSTISTNGFGAFLNTNFGDSETYTVVKITKIR